MFYVYIQTSTKNNDIYVGSSDDLRTRFKYPNPGLVKATKPNMPWKLINYEAYFDKRDSTKRERLLKNHAAKKD